MTAGMAVATYSNNHHSTHTIRRVPAAKNKNNTTTTTNNNNNNVNNNNNINNNNINNGSTSSANSNSQLTKFGSFEIVYKNVDSIRLGDVIHGNVELTLGRPVLVRRMLVTFYGDVHYEDNKQRLRTHVFESQTQELWREPHTNETGAYLQRGFYMYEFYVGTRLDLPSSFVATDGSVVHSLVYYCEVKIVEQSALDDSFIEHVKRKPLQLRAMCSDPPNARRPGTVIEKDVMYVKNVLDASGCVGATLLINKRHCVPGEILFYNVEVLNCFRKLDVFISLVQRAKVRSKHHYYPVFEDVTHQLYKVKLGAIKSSEAYKRWIGEQLWIPDTSRIGQTDVRDFYGEKLVPMGYAVILTIRPVVGKSMVIETPLVVSKWAAGGRQKLRNGTVISGAATV